MESELKELVKNGLKDLMPEMNSKTIVGEEVVLPNGNKVFPVVKISTGYVGGGGEYPKKKTKSTKPCALGLGYGSVCEPVGFFVAGNEFSFVPIKQDNTMLKVVQKLGDAFCFLVKNTSKTNLKKLKEKNKNAKK